MPPTFHHTEPQTDPPRTEFRALKRSWVISSIRAASFSGLLASHSQIVSTRHPISANRRAFSPSRSTFAASFGTQ